MIVTTRVYGLLGECRCYVDMGGNLGVVVIGQGRNEYQAQNNAAKFLDTNYSTESIEWVGGYRGGDTDGMSPNTTYWRD